MTKMEERTTYGKNEITRSHLNTWAEALHIQLDEQFDRIDLGTPDALRTPEEMRKGFKQEIVRMLMEKVSA